MMERYVFYFALREPPTGDAISMLIDFASGVIEGFEDKLGGVIK